MRALEIKSALAYGGGLDFARALIVALFRALPHNPQLTLLKTASLLAIHKQSKHCARGLGHGGHAIKAGEYSGKRWLRIDRICWKQVNMTIHEGEV
jgi:hypothetical protein